MSTTKQTAYERITARIIELLEQGVCPWRKPWSSQTLRPCNFIGNRPYSGINRFLLEAMGFDSPYFLTFNQVKMKGGSIIKGSKGVAVVYWGAFEAEGKGKPAFKPETPESATEDSTRKIPFLKFYTVFNASQVEGIEFPELATEELPEFQPIAAAEKIVADWIDGPEILHGYNSACYVPAIDTVKLPIKPRFKSPEEYYSTLFHELGHATGSERRLKRNIGKASFASSDYSREELVAEMTAAFLCAECGIDNSVIENSVAYLQGWMKVLKADSKMVVIAASQAQKAANLILGRLEGE